jgi:small subunit ribosomal protein S1
MTFNQPGLDDNMNHHDPTTVDNIPDTDPNTQERSDANAAIFSSDDTPTPVENINTDEAITPADTGELSGGPGESVTPDDAGEAPAADETAAAPAAPARPNSRYTRGQLVEGTISATTPTSVTVDLGDGVQGVIPGRELERMSRKQIEDLQAGSVITVYVVNPNDHQGNVVLSVNRAAEEIDWQQAEEYRGNQQAYEGVVAGYNKGGLIVRFGRLRGFVPQSQVSDDRRRVIDGQTPEDRYSSMVNDTIVVKVMEVDRGRNRLILSERAAMRERRERRKEDLIDRLSVGQVLDGRVVSLEDFGAFVDVGGAEGLVHLTELSWKHVTHPRDFLKVGQTVRVEVISVDPERKRIGLSMKRQEADPWDEVATAYGIGQLVQATITKLTKFGAFARLVDAADIEGLVHISELSDQRVNHPREVVREGEKLTLRVVKVDVKNRRLGLSLKRVNSAEYLDLDLRFAGESSSDES